VVRTTPGLIDSLEYSSGFFGDREIDRGVRRNNKLYGFSIFHVGFIHRIQFCQMRFEILFICHPLKYESGEYETVR
jgi:hypothetical protein